MRWVAMRNVGFFARRLQRRHRRRCAVSLALLVSLGVSHVPFYRAKQAEVYAH